MSEEIKEILEELKEKNETYKECIEDGIIENEYYKSHLLLDYITNLQQENEQLKADYGSKSQVERDLLEYRIDKAVEYIKNNWYSKNTRNIDELHSLGDWRLDLLEILNGDKDE